MFDETEIKAKSVEFTFQNCQRILEGYPATSFTLVGFTLTLLSAGGAGLFIVVEQCSGERQWFWILLLSILMLVAVIMLGVVWYREHKLKNATIEYLKLEFNNTIGFPKEERCIQGWTRWMWKYLFILGGVFWVAVLMVAIWRLNPGFCRRLMLQRQYFSLEGQCSSK